MVPKSLTGGNSAHDLPTIPVSDHLRLRLTWQPLGNVDRPPPGGMIDVEETASPSGILPSRIPSGSRSSNDAMSVRACVVKRPVPNSMSAPGVFSGARASRIGLSMTTRASNDPCPGGDEREPAVPLPVVTRRRRATKTKEKKRRERKKKQKKQIRNEQRKKREKRVALVEFDALRWNARAATSNLPNGCRVTLSIVERSGDQADRAVGFLTRSLPVRPW